MQLAPGLHRLGDGLVNSYLVEEGGAITIVDAGMSGQYGDLERELAAMGRSKADIRAIVLTHGDTDHVGFADRLRQELGHPGLRERRRRCASTRRGQEAGQRLGADEARPDDRLHVLRAAQGRPAHEAVTELTPVYGDATLDLPGSPHLIPLPGHTPGSMAVYVPTVGALFLGDAMTTRSVLTGETGPRLAPFTLDPAAALASLTALDGLEAAWVLPGHGDAWTGGAGEALRQIREAAAKGPLPAARVG